MSPSPTEIYWLLFLKNLTFSTNMHAVRNLFFLKEFSAEIGRASCRERV